jgi:L-fuconolactonase
MQRHGLVLDLLIKPHQLDAALELALRRPGLRMVVDHAAKPAIASGTFEPWARQIARLARATHVDCKLSGLLTEASPGAGLEALRPYADHVLDAFGPARVLWGSDWPVLTLAASYGEWHGLCVALLSGLDVADQQLVFGGNAERLYKLG